MIQITAETRIADIQAAPASRQIIVTPQPRSQVSVTQARTVVQPVASLLPTRTFTYAEFNDAPRCWIGTIPANAPVHGVTLRVTTPFDAVLSVGTASLTAYYVPAGVLLAQIVGLSSADIAAADAVVTVMYLYASARPTQGAATLFVY